MTQKIDLDQLEVRNNSADKRFEVQLGAERAVITYDLRGDLIEFIHTGVPPAYKGQGIADRMAHVALEYARANHLRVLPSCPFVASYIGKHPEYQSITSRN